MVSGELLRSQTMPTFIYMLWYRRKVTEIKARGKKYMYCTSYPEPGYKISHWLPEVQRVKSMFVCKKLRKCSKPSRIQHGIAQEILPVWT